MTYFLSNLHQFSIVAIANYFKLNSFKKHKLITLQFCRSEVQYRSHRTKVKVLAGLFLSGGSGGVSIYLFFTACRGLPYSWAMNSLPHLHSQQCCTSLTLFPWSYLLLTKPSWNKFSDFKASCDQFGFTWIIQAPLTISRSVDSITSLKLLLPCTPTYSKFPRLGCGHLQGTIILPTTELLWPCITFFLNVLLHK